MVLKVVKALCLWVGTMVGITHFALGLKAAFVMRANESGWLWLALLTGPLSTLPAMVVWVLGTPRLSGLWLIVGGFLSVAFFSQSAHDVVDYGARYSLPMIALGVVALLDRRVRKRPTG